jgi:hypothetical protein
MRPGKKPKYRPDFKKIDPETLKKKSGKSVFDEMLRTKPKRRK